MDKILSTENLKLMSENRKLVLDLSTDIAVIIDKNKDEISINELDRFIAMALVGITFSLWRAVPLVHKSNEPIDIVDASHQYLDKIVRHNAITYNDDDQKRFWSFGYYMGNARYRITELCTGWVAADWAEGREAVDRIGLLNSATTHRKPGDKPADKLSEYIKITRAIVDIFDCKFK